MVLMDAILVTGKEDARCEGETSGGKDKEEWEVRDEGYGASRLVVQLIDQHIKFHPSDDFTDIF